MTSEPRAPSLYLYLVLVRLDQKLPILDNHFPDAVTVAVAARHLKMALRAAGIAAVALGYHFWKLLTKQEPSEDQEPTLEVN